MRFARKYIRRGRRMLQAGSLRSPDEELRVSSLFLHNEYERPD